MSHVFGLRAASNVKIHPTDGVRIASDGTASSTSTKVETKAITGKATIRPLVVRDPYQNIGIRKGSGGKTDDDKMETTQENHEPVSVHRPEHEVTSCRMSEFRQHLIILPHLQTYLTKVQLQLELILLMPKPPCRLLL